MKASIKRETKETRIEVNLEIDASGDVDCETGVPLLDEVLRAVAVEAGLSMKVAAEGDLLTGDHHTVEDAGIAVGSAIAMLAEKGSGCFTIPSGECLAVAAVRFGEPGYRGEFSFESEMAGGMALQNLGHFMRALAYNGRFTLHIRADGHDDRRKVDAISRAVGRAIGLAIRDGRGPGQGI